MIIAQPARRRAYAVPWFAPFILLQAVAALGVTVYLVLTGAADDLPGLVPVALAGTAFLVFVALATVRVLAATGEHLTVSNMTGRRNLRLSSVEVEIVAKRSRQGVNHSLTLTDGVSEPYRNLSPTLGEAGIHKARAALVQALKLG